MCVEDPILGLVKFKPLGFSEWLDMKGKTTKQRTQDLVWKMLKPANPKMTREQLEKMHGPKAVRLTMILSEYVMNFLQGSSVTTLADGLNEILTPKQSGS